jgi:hypothetical protein
MTCRRNLKFTITAPFTFTGVGELVERLMVVEEVRRRSRKLRNFGY